MSDLIGRKFFPPPVAVRRVAASAACRRCGYDLRTLRVDGVCPECGLGVFQSLHRRRGWRRRKARVVPQRADDRTPLLGLLRLGMCCALSAMVLLMIYPAPKGRLAAMDEAVMHWRIVTALVWAFGLFGVGCVVYAIRRQRRPGAWQPPTRAGASPTRDCGRRFH